MPHINIDLLDNFVENIDLTKFHISTDYIDTNLLNLIATDNSINLGIIINPNKQSRTRSSKGVRGKKPGNPKFNIKNHLNYIEKLKNNKIPNLDLSAYLFQVESSHPDYINNLKYLYEYDIYSNYNDISYILNKYYYKTS